MYGTTKIDRQLIAVILLGSAIAAHGLPPSSHAADTEHSNKRASQIERGETLFRHAWLPNDPLSAGGDGLGPLFNAASCVACHKDGGVGGSGGEDHNVDVVHLSSNVATDAASSLLLRTRLAELHRGFLLGTAIQRSITLHARGTSPSYEQRRDDILMKSASNAIGSRTLSSVKVLPSTKDVMLFELTQRNTPSLFGLSQLDNVSAAQLQEIARQQQSRGDGISGRVGKTTHGDGIGRFGWRGQISSIEEFVRGACVNELGLQNEGHFQSPDPSDLVTPASQKPDVSEQQIQDMVAFIRSLPEPKQVLPAEGPAKELVSDGLELFRTVGCATCHLEHLDRVQGAFTDLLLHDMGEELYDPLPAAFEESAPSVTSISPSGYYGSPAVISTGSTTAPAQTSSPSVLTRSRRVSATEIDRAIIGLGRNLGVSGIPLSEQAATARREWRTPPLWGIADTAPYMHDGRSATLPDAIMAHGGEGSASRLAYLQLEPAKRLALLAFLESLRGPHVQ
jgi:CxxC motif-containing protein (DUF1111 family)